MRKLLLLLRLWLTLTASSTMPGLLAAANRAGTTLTTLYTSANYTTVTLLVVANRDSNQHKFRISLAPGGAADDPSQYIYYDLPIGPNNSVIQFVNWPLIPGDVVRMYDDAQQLTVQLYGWTSTP